VFFQDTSNAAQVMDPEQWSLNQGMQPKRTALVTESNKFIRDMRGGASTGLLSGCRREARIFSIRVYQ
jgi:hypothetical protein